MYKHIFASIGIAGILIVSGSFLARPLEAQVNTVDQIQAQIKELLAKVADLTKQLNSLRAGNQGSGTFSGSDVILNAFTPTTSTPSKHRVCAILYRNLLQGSSGYDVTGLQEFLRDEGHFSANPTGN